LLIKMEANLTQIGLRRVTQLLCFTRHQKEPKGFQIAEQTARIKETGSIGIVKEALECVLNLRR